VSKNIQQPKCGLLIQQYDGFMKHMGVLKKKRKLRFEHITTLQNNILSRKITQQIASMQKYNLIFCVDWYKKVPDKMNEYEYIWLHTLHLLLLIECGGNIVINIPDSNHYTIYEMIYLLSTLFEKVIISKPYISNILHSDKYIICKTYRNNMNSYVLCEYINRIKEIHSNKAKSHTIPRYFQTDIPLIYRSKIDESNVIIGQQQLENMGNIIHLCFFPDKKERIEFYEKRTKAKSEMWLLQNSECK
jgi:hypothetical protein